jgi:hypothetical protein
MYTGSLKLHESNVHHVKIEKEKIRSKPIQTDQLYDYILMLFKLVMLHRNLDTAVDMGDGERCVRSAKYELLIYNKTGKTKYTIGSIHLTALTSGVLPVIMFYEVDEDRILLRMFNYALLCLVS